jgi:hypothetical protein
MTVNVPSKSKSFVKGTALTFTWPGLVSQADTDIFKTNPTLALGDFKLIADGAVIGNLTNTPTVINASYSAIQFSLTTAETNYDQAVIACHDGAGDEWQDVGIMIFFDANLVLPALADIAPAVLDAVAASYDDAGSIGEAINSASTFDPAADEVTLAAASVTAVQSSLSTFDPATDSVSLANDGITAAKISADAITKIQSGLSTLTAQQVWEYAQRTLTSFGTLIADILANIATSWTQIEDLVVGRNRISVYQNSNINFTINGLGNISDRTKLYFGIKKKATLPDTESLVLIEESDGLMYANGSPAGELSTSASITVNDELTGSVTINIEGVAAGFAVGEYLYGVKIIRPSYPKAFPLAEGFFNIKQVTVKAVS